MRGKAYILGKVLQQTMSRQPVTLKDLAKALGVSPSTVSRALKDSHEISDATKQAVWRLAQKLDYQPNLIAQRLLSRRSYTVGVIVPEISYFFNSEAIRGIEDILLKAGYNLTICQTHESYSREVQHCENLLANRVDGIISSISGETQQLAHFHRIREQGIPLVLFDRGFNVPNVSKVMIDNEEAAATGVAHLIGTGCRRIAFLMGPANLPIANARKRGYLRALEAAAIPFDPALTCHCQFSGDMGLAAAMRLLRLSPRPDAIFAINDRIALGVLAAARKLGLRVPEDLSVLGFNDEPYSALLSPSLSTILQPAYPMGQEAARMFLRQLEDPAAPPEVRILQTRLVVRESTRG